MGIRDLFRKKNKNLEGKIPPESISKITLSHYSLVQLGMVEFNNYSTSSDMVIIYYDGIHETSKFIFDHNVNDIIDIVKEFHEGGMVLIIRDDDTDKFSIVYDKYDIMTYLYNTNRDLYSNLMIRSFK